MFKKIISYLRTDNINCQAIDTLTDVEKLKLSAFDRELIEKIYQKTLNKLSTEMLKENLSPEYVRGARFSLKLFKENFREYTLKNNKK